MPDAPTRGAGRRAALPPGMAPRYLSREEAAAYLGVGADTFDAEVAKGWWPPARRRGEQGVRLTWDRHALDAAADQASGLARAPESVREEQRTLAEAAALAGVKKNAPPRLDRPQHRQAAAR
jgi:hypothetical protein